MDCKNEDLQREARKEIIESMKIVMQIIGLCTVAFLFIGLGLYSYTKMWS